MRLNKFLSDAGVASRRGAERLLAEGRVAVNGQVVTEPGAQADPERYTITVDGRPIGRPERHRYLMLNKPAGVVSTASDTRGRRTVLDLVDVPERVFPVGRLDRDTEGLLLLTNDGEWANRVMHPSGGIDKEYVALVDGIPTAETLQRLAQGVLLPDGHIGRGKPRVLETLDGGARVSLILHEGHKRQARLMFGAVGHPVRHLERVRVGGLLLGALPRGAWRELTPDEVAAVTRPPREHDEQTRAHRNGGTHRDRSNRASRSVAGDTGAPGTRRAAPSRHRH